jgi:thiol:disulfide interchange protein DsbD
MKNRVTQVILLLLLMVTGSAHATDFGGTVSFGEADILPVDDAFALTVVREGEGLQLLWQIQPGYYLYRHRISVAVSERVGTPQIPEGVHKQDEYFGDVEVYYEALVVDVPLDGHEEETFIVQYQGCADAGICYPPQKRSYKKKYAAKF